jgi:hypothetical protein
MNIGLLFKKKETANILRIDRCESTQTDVEYRNYDGESNHQARLVSRKFTVNVLIYISARKVGLSCTGIQIQKLTSPLNNDV